MNNTIQINDDVTIGSQPSAEELRDLCAHFKSIVNFRNEGEDEDSLSPHDEGDLVHSAGVEYLHVPVVMKAMDPEQVDKFRDQYPQLPKPVFAHCKTGKRAGAMVLMQQAVEQGLNGEQLLAEADRLGVDCHQPQLEQFVRHYVDQHAIGP